MSAPLPVEPTETPQPKPVEAQVTTPPVSAETPEEPFDKTRAMETITKLRDIEKQAKHDKKELETLRAEKQTQLDAQLTETERLKKQADELKITNAQLQADILRRDVVSETGLPAVFADRLKGTTKEEMLADAKELLKAIPAQTPKAPHLSNSNPNAAGSPETEAQTRERVLGGRQKNIFDLSSIKERGGGVRIITKEE